MSHRIIEEINYANDPRVRANQWWKSINRHRMTATVVVYEDDEETVRTVPITFEKCSLCEGSGTHVNPSIDSHGLTAEDFHEDPDFAESYRSGSYDQTCNLCGGERVMPVCQDEDTNKYLEEEARLEAESHAERMSEIRMGA